MDDQQLAFDMEFVCCGYDWKVKRSLKLAKRLEQSFGPIEPLASRLERGEITLAMLAKIYGELLKDERQKPTQDDIEEWVFEHGSNWCGKQIAVSLYMLIMGSGQLRRVTEMAAKVKDKAQADANAEAGGDARSPFSRQAS
jgi:hypothetical protein